MAAHVHARVNCAKLVEIVTDYLEGALDPAVATDFEEHLAMCGMCTEYVEQMRAIQAAAPGTITEESLPPETRAGLLEAFRDWKGA
jgi:anti-sigma factor RsiW